MEHDQWHAIITRLERFEARMDACEHALGALKAELRPRLEGIETRLAEKASTTVVAMLVSLWGGTLAVLLAIVMGILLQAR